MSDTESPLYFLHIPKTAGTAYRTYLEYHYHHAEVLPWWLLEDIAGRSHEELSRFKLLMGHHGWYLCKLLERPLRIVSLLRDPVQRSVSHFADLARREANWIYPIIKQNAWTFEDFVTSPLGQSELANFMTRHLVHDRVQEDYWDHSSLRDSDFPALLAKYTNPAMLDVALEHAAGFEIFGHVERFNDALVLTAHKNGWAPVGSFLRLNAREGGANDVEVTPRALEALAEITRLDTVLYEWCVRRFDAEMAKVTPDRVDADYRRTMGAMPRVDRAGWNFELPLRGGGWLPRDWKRHLYEREIGVCVRSFPRDGEAFVDVPLAPGLSYEVRLYAAAPGASTFPRVGVRVNGVDLATTCWTGKFGEMDGRVHAARVPQGVIARSPEFTRVELRHVPDDPADNARTPILVRWLSILPVASTG